MKPSNTDVWLFTAGLILTLVQNKGLFYSEVSSLLKVVGLILKPWRSVGKPKGCSVGSTQVVRVLCCCECAVNLQIFEYSRNNLHNACWRVDYIAVLGPIAVNSAKFEYLSLHQAVKSCTTKHILRMSRVSSLSRRLAIRILRQKIGLAIELQVQWIHSYILWGLFSQWKVPTGRKKAAGDFPGASWGWRATYVSLDSAEEVLWQYFIAPLLAGWLPVWW